MSNHSFMWNSLSFHLLTENDIWIYGQRKHLGNTDGGFLLIPAETPISKSFTFNIPEMTPASFESKTCAIIWTVRVAQESDEGKQITIAKTTFRKGSLYHCMPGFIPVAKQERQWSSGLLGSNHALRAEARLTKDTYIFGEAVRTCIVFCFFLSIFRNVSIYSAIFVAHHCTCSIIFFQLATRVLISFSLSVGGYSDRCHGCIILSWLRKGSSYKENERKSHSNCICHKVW